MVGAAVVGGVAGFALMGPLAAVVGVGGAAYAATRSDGVGDAARATGKAAVAVGDKATELDREHDISGKAKKAAADAAQAAYAHAPSPGGQLALEALTRRSIPATAVMSSTRSTTSAAR